MPPRRLGHLRGPSFEHAPLVVAGVVFLLTCWLGATLLLLGPPWIRDTYVLLSGARIGSLSANQVAIDLLLLNAAPAGLIVGWLAIRRPSRAGSSVDAGERIPWPLAALVLALVYAYLGFRLVRADSIEMLSAWGDYGRHIAARRELIDDLSFLEFGLAYTAIPFLSGHVVAELFLQRPKPGAAVGTGVFLALTYALLNLALFQKRPLLIGLITGASYVAFRLQAGGKLGPLLGARRRTRRLLLGMAALLASTYLVGLFAPLIASDSTFSSSQRPKTNDLLAVVEQDFEEGAEGWRAGDGIFTASGGRACSKASCSRCRARTHFLRWTAGGRGKQVGSSGAPPRVHRCSPVERRGSRVQGDETCCHRAELGREDTLVAREQGGGVRGASGCCD
jgi:hypothetical protein